MGVILSKTGSGTVNVTAVFTSVNYTNGTVVYRYLSITAYMTVLTATIY